MESTLTAQTQNRFSADNCARLLAYLLLLISFFKLAGDWTVTQHQMTQVRLPVKTVTIQETLPPSRTFIDLPLETTINDLERSLTTRHADLMNLNKIAYRVVYPLGTLDKTSRTVWKIDNLQADIGEPATIMVSPQSDPEVVAELKQRGYEVGYILNRTTWRQLPEWADPSAPVCTHPGYPLSEILTSHPVIDCFRFTSSGKIKKTTTGGVIVINAAKVRQNPKRELGKIRIGFKDLQTLVSKAGYKLDNQPLFALQSYTSRGEPARSFQGTLNSLPRATTHQLAGL